MQLRPTIVDPVDSQPFPFALVYLSQPRITSHRQPMVASDLRRRVDRAREVASVDRVDRLATQSLAQEPGLLPALGVERNVDLALIAPLVVPIGPAMPAENQRRHGVAMSVDDERAARSRVRRSLYSGSVAIGGRSTSSSALISMWNRSRSC